MHITYQKQDLFTVSKQYVIAHCIAQDARLGAGIALQFRNKYPNMIKYLNQKRIHYPGIAKYQAKDGRIIYNLIDKNKSNQKPQRNDLIQTLHQLKNSMQKNDETHLAIPLIGAGLDQLSWLTTEKNIKDIFQNTNIDIVICQNPKH